MPIEIQLQVTPEVVADEQKLKHAVAQKAGVSKEEVNHVQILKRSIDARRGIKVNLKVDLFVNEEFVESKIELPAYQDVSTKEPLLIIGAGPAGLFAALRAIELGRKPIIIERGKDVRQRRRDLKAITIEGIVNPESNYCFGEGGAGTYSDGKLYTRSRKRGDVNRILEILVGFGATPEIMVEAHPHIGTNKLPQIIEQMREKILAAGGEVHFNQKLTDILLNGKKIKGIQTASGEIFESKQVILATGHSARDIFELLYEKEILIEAKPFALGLRVEHQQNLIDQIQYKRKDRGTYLPPAPYKVVKQVGGRGVYSFCMCPGGIVAPCATQPGEVVTNGWSPSTRNQATSNSGIVVELRMADFDAFEDNPLKALRFQQMIERKAWEVAGESIHAPAQRLNDFINGKVSQSLPKTSYMPGLTSAKLDDVLPVFITNALKEGFRQIGKSMPRYLTNDAVLHAVESRTSSPVRIPRDKKTYQHPQIEGLYPCGEGAGFAGGIVSAAIDGEKCAEMAVK